MNLDNSELWQMLRSRPGNFVSLLMAGLLYLVWQQRPFIYSEPNIWFMLFGLSSLALFGLRVWWPAIVWWWLGFLTIFWSLTPGNTFILGLWEMLYLAAFAAGRWRASFWILNIVLLFYNLGQSLSMSWAGLALYASGSTNYVTGAQALLLVAPSLYLTCAAKTKLQAVAGWFLLYFSLYACLISGARAVYLPLLLIVPLLVFRLVMKENKLRLVLTLVSVLIAVFVTEQMFPTPATSVLSQKVSPTAQVTDIQSGGSFAVRLAMYRQALQMGLAYPQGTGNGSYRETVSAFQSEPFSASASPHNYYLETFATTGWLRLGALLGLLLVLLWHAWRQQDIVWAFALSAAAYWLTLAFDITGSYPSSMMLAFWSLGTLYGEKRALGHLNAGVKRYSYLLTLLVMIGMVSWWFSPCNERACANERYLGLKRRVGAIISPLDSPKRLQILAETEQLYPKSLWVKQEQLSNTVDSEQRTAILYEIIREFPFSSQKPYLVLATELLKLNRAEAALEVLEIGLENFPPDVTVFTSPFNEANYANQAAWLEEAQALSEVARSQLGEAGE